MHGQVGGRRAARHPLIWPVALSLIGASLTGMLVASTATARHAGHASHRRADSTSAGSWVASWAASPQGATPATQSQAGFAGQTLREVIFTSVGGSMVRVSFTDAFGSRPLRIADATVGVTGSGAGLERGTVRPLSFLGRRSTTIEPGSRIASDPVSLAVTPLERLDVSIFLPDPTGPATQHVEARQINYLAPGDHADDPSATPFSELLPSWYFLESVDVLAPPSVRGTVVALGDSITDGVGSTVGADARWPNDLARRLDARTGPTLGVVDEGIGGNRVLTSSACCGESALDRFDLDVLARSGVRTVILLEGVNDIDLGTATEPPVTPHSDLSALAIIAGYKTLIERAHAAGVRIIGGTLTPFAGSPYWSPAGEAKREAINRWILTSGAFDGVVNFASAVADPGDPQRLRPAYDSGDHIHPNDAGYRAMADAVNLRVLFGSTPGG